MGVFYKLVFSNNTRFRIARHVLFWFIWITFYALVKAYQMTELQGLPFSKAFPVSWLEVLIQIPVDIAFCYLVLYFLLPRLFLKGWYLSFALLWILLLFIAAVLQHIYYFWAVPHFRLAFDLKPPVARGSLLLGALSIMGSFNAEGGFTAAIRLGKLFFIKEKESELLVKEIKRVYPGNGAGDEAPFQPTFLYNVLSRLYSLGEKQMMHPAETLRKINNLILYCGYDSRKTMLPLSKELEALQEYIELEKLSYQYAIEVRYELRGSPSNKTIIPYVLIPLAENAFSTLSHPGNTQPFVYIDISIDNDQLQVNIKSSKNPNSSTLLDVKNLNVINIEKRLQLRYPGGFRLSKTIEPHSLMLSLQVDLSSRLGM